MQVLFVAGGGQSPRQLHSEPEEADKAIKVDQVRDLASSQVQTAQLGGRKVVLVEPVEAMNINAANALLKSLEEPSGNTVLLLVSHQSSRLLPIHSQPLCAGLPVAK